MDSFGEVIIRNIVMSKKEVAVIEEEVPNEMVRPLVGGLAPTARDIDIPLLNVVQGTSEIDAPVGSLVIDKRHILTEVDVSVRCIPMAHVKGMREDKPFGHPDPSRAVYTDAEVEKLKKESEFSLIEFANVTVIFPQPEDAKGSSAFPFKIGDSQYAIGTIMVKKLAYRNTYKRLITHESTRQDEPIYSVFWDFTPIKISSGITYYTPSLSLSDTEDKVPQDVIDWVDRFRTS